MKLLSISQSKKTASSLFSGLVFPSLSVYSVCSAPPKFFRDGFKQAGKKEGGLGEGIFDRLLSRKAGLGWEAAHLCVSKETKPAKIVSLIEKEFCARSLKDVLVFAGFDGSRQAASRWTGSAHVKAQIVARKRFELRSVIATISDFFQIQRCFVARSPRLRRVFACFFPYISAINQKDEQNQKQFLCSSGGGSWWQSHQSKSSLNRIIERFCSPIFSVCRKAARQSKFLNPALFAPKA